MSELPEGWTWATVSDVTQDVHSVNPDSEYDDEFGYIDISSINNSTYSITEVKKISGANAPSRARRPVQTNDVLFCNVRTYLRNIAIVPHDSNAQICSTGFTVLRPNEAVDPRYLFRWVLTDRFIEQVTPQQTGTHYPATSDRVVKAQAIPLPPLNEQHRIVAKLEKLLSRMDTTQARLATIPRILKRFRQSLLAAACSGKLTADWRADKAILRYEHRIKTFGTESSALPPLIDNTVSELPSEWAFINLRPLVKTLDQGWSPKCEVESSPSSEVWGVIKTTAVQAINFIEGENKRLPATLAARPSLELKAGDLLITRAGPRIRAGVCCLVRSVRPRLMICDKVYRFRVNESTVVPEFLVLALNTPSIVAHIDTLKTGISESGLNLTQQKFLDVEIPLPSLSEQEEIVRRVEALFKTADALEARYLKAKAQVDKLPQSILARAFLGELVPQDRNDEPASALLERIRRERPVERKTSGPIKSY